MVYGSIIGQKGVVEVESASEAGTNLHIYLPLIDAEAETTPTVEDVAAPGHGECILLADDEESHLIATCEVLESLGYKVFRL